MNGMPHALSILLRIGSVLEPAGPQASHIDRLGQVMIYTLAAIFLIVMILLALSVRGRGGRAADHPIRPDEAQDRKMSFVVAAGIVASIAVLFVLLTMSLIAGRRVYALGVSENALTITVTSHQWWWHAQYNNASPHRTLNTANELHLPVGRPVLIRLRSADVIHSFWVPSLHGKTDLIPGHETTTWLQADKPGVYRGRCAEFCGYQHAHMAFTVVAETPGEFEQWYNAQLQPALEPSTARESEGRSVFLRSGCILCHRIQGTSAGATIGPDLTHLASRSMIAAGTLDNTRDQLRAWIVDSQRIKPGNHMPPQSVRAEDLEALLDYLQSLR